MKIESLKLAYFSPTGTSKKVVKGIAQGINHEKEEIIDITIPGNRKNSLDTNDSDLLVIAVPVYMGRIPSLLMEWFESLKADNTPVVCVVVYGNREYDDALLELKNTVIKSGGKPIACGAFIGEHSFSSIETPTAMDRPDKEDMNYAELFGKKIKEKIDSIFSIDDIQDVDVPGNYPYGGVTKLWDVDFIKVSDECSECGTCYEVCPVDAIDSKDYSLIDIKKCITCCACIKNCPENARSIKESDVKNAAIRLSTLCKERKDPQFFV